MRPFVVHLFMQQQQQQGHHSTRGGDVAFHTIMWQVCQDLMYKFRPRSIYTNRHHVFMLFYPSQREMYTDNLLITASGIASFASIRFVENRPRNQRKYRSMYFVSEIMSFESSEEIAEFVVEEFYNNYTEVVSQLGFESKELENVEQWKLFGVTMKMVRGCPVPIVCDLSIDKATTEDITHWLEAECVE